jgi:hypothetical protein
MLKDVHIAKQYVRPLRPGPAVALAPRGDPVRPRARSIFLLELLIEWGQFLSFPYVVPAGAGGPAQPV